MFCWVSSINTPLGATHTHSFLKKVTCPAQVQYTWKRVSQKYNKNWQCTQMNKYCVRYLCSMDFRFLELKKGEEVLTVKRGQQNIVHLPPIMDGKHWGRVQLKALMWVNKPPQSTHGKTKSEQPTCALTLVCTQPSAQGWLPNSISKWNTANPRALASSVRYRQRLGLPLQKKVSREIGDPKSKGCRAAKLVHGWLSYLLVDPVNAELLQEISGFFWKAFAIQKTLLLAFNANSDVFQATFFQNRFCYIPILNVLEESVELRTIQNYNKENNILKIWQR